MNPRRPGTTSAAAFVLPAILGLVLAAALSNDLSATASPDAEGRTLTARQTPGEIAAPSSAPALVFETVPSVRPGLPVAAETTAGFAPLSTLCLNASERGHRADLVAALILQKYLHFRESLSTP